jgi:hypothetical protein
MAGHLISYTIDSAPSSFLAPLPGTEEEETPTSTIFFPRQLGTIKQQSSFLAPLPGTEEEETPTSTIFFPCQLGTIKQQASFLTPLPGKKWKTSARGVFRTHILYFVLSFALLYFLLASFYIKNPKKN